MPSRFVLFLFLCHVSSLGVFLYGFLPLTSVDDEFANKSSLPDKLNEITLNVPELYQPKIQRVIFIVIDALRKDFIVNEKLMEHMPFLWKLQNDSIACVYKAEAHTPTVTLPRIKAMVTGKVPSFADVILNLGSPALSEDSLLFQFKASNHTIVFYGDETWLKLFPTTFNRFEGTTSFFVNDYTEVDLNVTRNLRLELKQSDWSVMVLHYLGLDHIGHVDGPRSPLVPLKLREMDNVIREIFHSFHQNDTLIIICGDHGISDSGSHGGSSPAEVEVPLIFVMEGCVPDTNTYLQIDITATLATLLGVPLPKGNLGYILPGILKSLPWDRKVYIAFMNAKTIASSAGRNDEDEDYQRALKLYEDWLVGNEKKDPEHIAGLFMRSAKRMSSRILANLTSFDLYVMILGITQSIQVLLCFSCRRFSTLGGIGSFNTLFIIWIVATAGHVMTCLSLDNRSGLCFKETPTLPIIVLNFYVLVLFTSLSYFTIRKLSWNYKSSNNKEIFLASGSVFHALSMAASSFIEEEHQTYYYFVTTLTILLAWNNLRKNKPIAPLFGALLVSRIARMWNQTGDKWINEPDMEDWLNKSENNMWLLMSSGFGALGIFVWIKRCLHLKPIQLIGAGVCLMAALAYRAAIGMFELDYPKSLGITEAAVGYASLLGIAAFSEDGPSTVLTLWILLTSMLKRPHNLMLTCQQLVQYSLLQCALREQLSPFFNGLAHYWVGMAWYFQQGNANNLARIDVASGYVGLPYYNATLVGFLLSCATFSGPALAFLLANRTTRDLNQLYGFLWPRILIAPVFLVVITSLRYHLFVWTVFSPKLLYEGAMSCFILLLLIGKYILS